MRRVVIAALLALTYAVARAQDVRTYIPKNAYTYLPVLKTELYQIIPETPYPEYFGGLAEQESCISLTHSRCWLPTSTLNTKRELGVGLFQLTKAYNPDGSIRFDSLEDARRAYRTELRDLTWDNIAQRPDLQMRTMLLMTRKNLTFFTGVHPLEQYKFADSAYNGGRGDVQRSRTKCSLTHGCDPNIWFDNVERLSVKSDKPIYGNRSAKMINNEHVRLIFEKRMQKYKPYLEKKEP